MFEARPASPPWSLRRSPTGASSRDHGGADRGQARRPRGRQAQRSPEREMDAAHQCTRMRAAELRAGAAPSRGTGSIANAPARRQSPAALARRRPQEPDAARPSIAAGARRSLPEGADARRREAIFAKIVRTASRRTGTVSVRRKRREAARHLGGARLSRRHRRRRLLASQRPRPELDPDARHCPAIPSGALDAAARRGRRSPGRSALRACLGSGPSEARRSAIRPTTGIAARRQD